MLLNLIRSARTNVLRTSLDTGFTARLADSEWRRKKLLILCYHGLSLRDEHEWNPELFVTVPFLRRRFQILRDKNYNVLPLGEAVSRLSNGTLPQRAVAITFDDGFYNFHAAAVGLLEEFALPATVYVSSYHVTHQRPLLQLSLHYFLWRARNRLLPPHSVPNQPNAIDLSVPANRDVLAHTLVADARALTYDRSAQMAWLSNVAEKLDVSWDDYSRERLFHLMTPAEITDVARRGVDVQLHTHRHRTPRNEAQFCNEIRENRRILESFSNTPATHFCYPSGDTDPMFLPWLRELSVATATTCIPRLAKRGDDPLLLPRFIDAMGQSEVTFESWLAGIAGAMRI